jgi:hypothetical protein
MKFSVFHQLVGNSGFVWGEDHFMPTADDNVWGKYLKKPSEAKESHKKMLPDYSQLDENFSGSVVMGEYAFSSAVDVRMRTSCSSS